MFIITDNRTVTVTRVEFCDDDQNSRVVTTENGRRYLVPVENLHLPVEPQLIGSLD